MVLNSPFSILHSQFVLRSVLLLCFALLLTACPDGDGPSDAFDRKQMLTDMSDRLIIPAYDSLSAANELLSQSVDAFTEAPSELLLEACRSSWRNALLFWNDACPFNFGPAEGIYGTLTENVATFPTDTQLIEQYILAGDTLFQNFDRDSRGYYTLDYLLFRADPTTVTQDFLTDVSKNRSAYLRSVIRNIIQLTEDVRTKWKSSYRADFISRNGTDAGSGTSLLFNHMLMSYELLKNYKLALPLGKRAGQTATEPDKVEALYSDYSIVLFKRHYNTIMNIWSGHNNDEVNFLGFEEYLQAVPNGDRLITETKIQDANVRIQLNALQDSESMRGIIQSNPTRLDPLFEELQKLTKYIKSELSSLIGIAITYSSGDGD